MQLEKIHNPQDVKKLNIKEQEELAQEIREKIINTVSKTGGHLASNLGVVELTIAIHNTFDLLNDKVIWDVGHQTYVHKILTGRADKLDTLRKFGGIAGFPKTEESEYDHFNTGHSSTSISVALGMAHTRDLKNEKHSVVAVIGDGALTGGMALEALNDASCSKTNILVILNDNEMSISKNVGGMALMLSKLRTRKFYINTNVKGKNVIRKIPFIGKRIVKCVQDVKRSIKQIILPNMYFENLGYTYIGPVDGHNLKQLEKILETCKNLKGPILLHVITKKGKGYKPAEENPDTFHSTSSFNIATGEKNKKSGLDYSAVFGDELVKLARENEKIVAITAAMKDGTGLTEFSKEFPKRFFDVGIAEQHAIGMAAGMAKDGFIPVVPMYSSFLQRAYDQLIHDVAIQNLPVVICADRAGIVGNDGETHQGLFDLSFTNSIPNFTIMAPRNFTELREMLDLAVTLNKPVLIRYPRGGEEVFCTEETNKEFDANLKNSEKIVEENKENLEKLEEESKKAENQTKEIVNKTEISDDSLNKQNSNKLEYGKAEILKEGTDFTIVAIGKMVERCVHVARVLETENNIKVTVINARFLKPLDEDTIWNSIKNTKNVITVEDGIIVGGLGSAVAELIASKNEKINLKKFAYPDEFIKHGSVKEIESKYKLDENSIKEYIIEQVEILRKAHKFILIKKPSDESTTDLIPTNRNNKKGSILDKMKSGGKKCLTAIQSKIKKKKTN
jgi:1-deoxy-D-xylulose-5-phosphate synthase